MFSEKFAKFTLFLKSTPNWHFWNSKKVFEIFLKKSDTFNIYIKCNKKKFGMSIFWGKFGIFSDFAPFANFARYYLFKLTLSQNFKNAKNDHCKNNPFAKKSNLLLSLYSCNTFSFPNTLPRSH